MEQEIKRQTNQIPQDEEIDLVEVIRKLWKNRKLIIKITVVFMVIGVLVALFSPKEYSAGCTMVPQVGDKKASGGLSGLASMVGINLGSMGGGEVLAPTIYPKILASIPFKKELMATPLKFEEYEQPVTLFDYYTKDEYKKFSLFGVVKKYTIGLPGVIIGAIRGEDTTQIMAEQGSAIQSLSKDEKDVAEILDKIVSLNVNDKDGYVQLSASMPEPLAVAQLAQQAQKLLQEYITRFKIEKVQSNLDFVQKQYDKAKERYEVRQDELAKFRDANKGFVSAVAKTREDMLTNEYNLAYSVYSELAKQLEQAEIAVNETTPILTVVEPVVVPVERSKPKRGLICVLFTFLGGFAGIGVVLGLPFLANTFGNDKLKKWIKE
ncbi:MULTISPECIES: Wzz/FepE/Etk N-terminal domain-containing protein [Butyricimonas]|uniref:Wzz/FepE/Etk N-terminal domain-containing protein n=1 Tax=Butyricimonas TaxID=574697 RepID=UPI001D05F76E|nr:MULTISPECIES: Wzz/FepE/Etk N-terminal domain-containing protein [Butyricimonas]MCB6972404.1 lipopolysaccharide biosynthesis protein [Butyricimonas synergistica]MCG4519412.1 Wzz/FepE/Etk N-terminal domain-containing protein [Butyricimonas sp. DFI.6.44]